MKNIIAAIALLAATIPALVLAASPACAEDYDKNAAAIGIVSIIVYDANCEKVPRVVRTIAEKAMTVIPAATLYAVKPQVDAGYTAAGAFKWCELIKPMIEAAVTNLNRQ